MLICGLIGRIVNTFFSADFTVIFVRDDQFYSLAFHIILIVFLVLFLNIHFKFIILAGALWYFIEMKVPSFFHTFYTEII